MSFSAPSSKRVLSVFALTMINVVAIDSIRNLPANAVMGLSVPLFYLVASLCFLLPCVLITAELATHHPRTGGSYIWVRHAFGRRFGFLTIWLQWIYNVFWYPTILAFLAANIAYFIDPSLATNKVYMVSMIIGIFLVATLANAYGMRLSAWLSTVSAIVGTIIPMLLIIVLGFGWWLAGKPLAIEPAAHHFIPHFNQMPNIAFTVIVFFSLMGMEMSAVHAEEVKNPKRNYPRALLYSSMIIVLSLVLASLSIALVVPKSSLDIVSGIDQAFVIFLNAFHLKWLLPFIIAAIVIGGFGGMSAWIIGPTKGLMVAAEAGDMPRILAYRSKRGAPIAVLILQCLIVIALACCFLFIPSFNTSYWLLSDLTAQLALLFYILLFAAAIRLRYTTPRDDEAYRIPGGNIGLWLVGCVGIISCVFAMVIGFIPPEKIQTGNLFSYELILAGGTLLFSLAPFLIHYFSHRKLQS